LNTLVVKKSLTFRSQAFGAREGWIGVALAEGMGLISNLLRSLSRCFK